MMDELIAGFAGQLEEAMAIGQKALINPPGMAIRNVIVSGLGGSGIGGNLVREILSGKFQLPFEVNKDYFLPAYAGDNSLVFISSYSGNTEETVHAMNEAIDRKCNLICVSSNGKVLETARQYDLNIIVIPGGMPPRACLGYSFVQQLYALKKLDMMPIDFENHLMAAIALLREEEDDIRKRAMQLAEYLLHKIPVIYISSHMESVALRFRQQLNENSKSLAWHHVIPEMNHNELVGWRHSHDDLAVVLFRNNNDYERIQTRMEINKEIISKYTPNVYEVYSKGESFIEQALYLIHLGDWASFYLAQMRNMDAVEVKVIDYLKRELSKS